ncbi:MAG: hypothetical protein LUG94_00115 [Ruminococcus sp.]|nr:hypothetical protein [Ruminococcus sp.]
MVIGNIKKPSYVKETLKGWANLIFACILSLLVSLFTSMLMSSNIWKGIIGLFTMAILLCIVGNYSYNCAKSHKAYERTYKANHNSFRHIVLGITISLPLILQWIVLMVLKYAKVSIGDSIFSIYRLINAYYLPWINVICPNHTLEELSIMGVLTMLAFIIMPTITFIVVYNIVYHNIDIEKIIVYNKE